MLIVMMVNMVTPAQSLKHTCIVVHDTVQLGPKDALRPRTEQVQGALSN